MTKLLHLFNRLHLDPAAHCCLSCSNYIFLCVEPRNLPLAAHPSPPLPPPSLFGLTIPQVTCDNIEFLKKITTESEGSVYSCRHTLPLGTMQTERQLSSAILRRNVLYSVQKKKKEIKTVFLNYIQLENGTFPWLRAPRPRVL